jgi:hypothetical protein
MKGRAAVVPLAAVITTCSCLLAGCGQSGQGFAQMACRHVAKSITLYRSSLHDPATTADREQQQAYAQLRDALPLAAAANSDNGQWNALMTTISESARVSESHLIVALQAQCAAVQNPQAYQAPPPSSPSNSTDTSPSG